MFLSRIANLDKKNINSMQNTASMIVAAQFVNTEFVIHPEYYNTVEFGEEDEDDCEAILGSNEELLCLIPIEIRADAATNIKACLIGDSLSSFQKKQRAITMIGILLTRTVSKLKVDTIMLLRQAVTDIRGKVAAFLQNLNATRTGRPKTFKHIKYDRLREWGLSGDTATVLDEIRNMFGHVVKQTAAILLKCDNFKQNAIRIEADTLPQLISDKEYTLIAAEAFQAVQAGLQQQVQLLRPPPRTVGVPQDNQSRRRQTRLDPLGDTMQIVADVDQDISQSRRRSRSYSRSRSRSRSRSPSRSRSSRTDHGHKRNKARWFQHDNRVKKRHDYIDMHREFLFECIDKIQPNITNTYTVHPGATCQTGPNGKLNSDSFGGTFGDNNTIFNFNNDQDSDDSDGNPYPPIYCESCEMPKQWANPNG